MTRNSMARARVRDISPAELAAESPRPRIIDVREPAEFTGPLGHIPGAELVPERLLTGASSSWRKDAALVVVCRSGARSARAAALLSELGFRAVCNLAGGMLAYVNSGLTLERR